MFFTHLLACLLTDRPTHPCIHPGQIRASIHVCIHACIHPSMHACTEPIHARMHPSIHPGIYPSIHCNTKSTHQSIQNQRKCLGVWYRTPSPRVSGSGSGLLDSESRPGSGIKPSTSPMRNHRLGSGKQNYLVLITLFRKSQPLTEILTMQREFLKFKHLKFRICTIFMCFTVLLIRG